jgi:hypothetical protein
MTLKSSFVEFAKISQNPYQYRMALRPFLIIAHTPYEKKLVSGGKKFRIRDCIYEETSYPEHGYEKKLASGGKMFRIRDCIYEETSYPEHGYEEFLVRRMRHKEWPYTAIGQLLQSPKGCYTHSSP